MARKDLQYTTLNNFAMGMYSKYGAASQLDKDGAARITDGQDRYTYGCYGDPDGGLRPLPAKVKTFSTDFTEEFYATGLPNTRNIDPKPGTKVGIIDFICQGGVYEASLTASTADEEQARGLQRSYPEASDLHPDTLYVLTSHRSVVYNSVWLSTSYAVGHADGTAWSSDGFLVGQFKSWNLGRMADSATSLTSVEMQLQCRIAAAEFGDPFWLAYVPADPQPFLLGYNAYYATDTDGWHAGTIALGRSVQAVGVPANGSTITLADLKKPGNVCVVACLQNGIDLCEPGERVVSWPNIFTVHGVWASLGPGYSSPTQRTAPQLSVPNATTKLSVDWTAVEVPYYLIEHQDRFVGTIRNAALGNQSPLVDLFDPDGNTATYSTNQFVEPTDSMRYTEFNAALVYDVTDATPSIDNMNIWKRLDAANPYAEVFGNSTPSGVGAMLSWNNDMLVVKHEGGASLVKGALEDSTVIRLPGAHSTGGVSCIPAYTPIGAVYGTLDGVAAWAGGDQTQIISPQLDGWFWDTGTNNEVSRDQSGKRKQGIAGRFGYQYPFVYAPNDYVMDVRTGGWFRLDDPDAATNPYPHMFYDTNNQGKVYAARGCYDANHLDCVDLYDPRTRTSEYQWISQPILASMLNEIVVDELILTAQGVGTITVTLVGIDGDEVAERFEVSSVDAPVRIAKNTNQQASELTVIIKSEGGFSTTSSARYEAPVVHSLNIGMVEAVGIARDNNA